MSVIVVFGIQTGIIFEHSIPITLEVRHNI